MIAIDGGRVVLDGVAADTLGDPQLEAMGVEPPSRVRLARALGVGAADATAATSAAEAGAGARDATAATRAALDALLAAEPGDAR